MTMLLIQGVICALIALWGVVMLLLGAIWGNSLWTMLGVVVLLVGLPFVRNMRRRDRPIGTDLRWLG
jgi:hypothetical protein